MFIKDPRSIDKKGQLSTKNIVAFFIPRHPDRILKNWIRQFLCSQFTLFSQLSSDVLITDDADERKSSLLLVWTCGSCLTANWWSLGGVGRGAGAIKDDDVLDSIIPNGDMEFNDGGAIGVKAAIVALVWDVGEFPALETAPWWAWWWWWTWWAFAAAANKFAGYAGKLLYATANSFAPKSLKSCLKNKKNPENYINHFSVLTLFKTG